VSIKKLNSRIIPFSIFRDLLDSFHLLDKPYVFFFINLYSFGKIIENDNFIDDVDYVFIDGQSLVFLNNIFSPVSTTKISFDYSSLAPHVFNFLSSNSLKVAFVGSSQYSIDIFTQNFTDLYPDVIVSYTRNGFFNSSEDIDQCITDLVNSNASVIVIGLGSPLQESFSLLVKNSIDYPCLIFTCGGFFTQESIKPNYFSGWPEKYNLRWLKRLLSERHVLPRILFYYPINAFRYIGHSLMSFFSKN